MKTSPSLPAARTALTKGERQIHLCQQAFWLEGRLMVALFAEQDEARYERLKLVRARAEWRYWRRRERAFLPGNQTPAWFYASAKAGY